MSYDINVVCTGNRCKQYFHKGRTFVEAKDGSDFVVEIKNNSWEKVLAVVSVDGLNVVDGKAADENGAGYVLDKYTAQKLYGFQYSSEKVASFKFGAFGAVKIDPITGKPEIDPQTGKEIPLGYAASKGDGSEKNAGIIGVRIWDEVPKPLPPPTPPNPAPAYVLTASWSGQANWACTASYAMSSSFSGNASFPITGCMSVNAVYSPQPSTWNAGGLYGPGRFGYGISTTVNANSRVYPSLSKGNLLREAIADAKAVRQTCLANTKGSPSVNDALQSNDAVYCCSSGDIENMITELEQEQTPDMASFDMETQWGDSRSYKVKETVFERREVIHRIDIYYASRESLIAMGVDLGTERRVSFPESFKESKYAKPPKGWKA